MNAIASLLERAKAQVADDRWPCGCVAPVHEPDCPKRWEGLEPAPSVDDPWPVGAWVELTVDGAPSTFGRVDFVDDGWVHWTALDGYAHASRPDALRRCR